VLPSFVPRFSQLRPYTSLPESSHRNLSRNSLRHSLCSSLQHRAPSLQTAKKKLMETHPNSKLGPNNCNHSRLTLANRNSTHCFSLSSLQDRASTLPNSNRPYCRLEINISPTKQRTEVLSNRPKSGLFESAFLIPRQWPPRPLRARMGTRSPHLKILLRNPSGLQDRACSLFHLAGT
jgi:hypothetical protein